MGRPGLSLMNQSHDQLTRPAPLPLKPTERWLCAAPEDAEVVKTVKLLAQGLLHSGQTSCPIVIIYRVRDQGERRDTIPWRLKGGGRGRREPERPETCEPSRHCTSKTHAGQTAGKGSAILSILLPQKGPIRHGHRGELARAATHTNTQRLGHKSKRLKRGAGCNS